MNEDEVEVKRLPKMDALPATNSMPTAI